MNDEVGEHAQFAADALRNAVADDPAKAQEFTRDPIAFAMRAFLEGIEATPTDLLEQMRTFIDQELIERARRS